MNFCFPASPLPFACRTADATRPNPSLPPLENPLASDDEDFDAETEPDLDDEQELSELAQKTSSAFHAAMSLEVLYIRFFFHSSNSC